MASMIVIDIQQLKINLKVFGKKFIASKIGPQIDIFFTNLYPNNLDLLNEYINYFRLYYLKKGYKKTRIKKGVVSLLNILSSNSLNYLSLQQTGRIDKFNS